MAATNEHVAWVKQAKRGWSQENDIIPIIRDVCNILLKTENSRSLIIDTTGRPPLLATTAFNMGPYTGPADSWRVSNILLKEPALDYSTILDYSTSYGEKPYVNTTEPVDINGNWYYPFPFAKADDALDGALPQIYFSRDPGTSTTRFYMQAYRAPTQVTSTRVPIPIPDSYGCHRLYLFPAYLKLIEGIDHGNVEEAVAYIEGTIKPLMWKALNKGHQGTRNRVTMRPY